MSLFETTADRFEKWAADLQSVADCKAYRRDVAARSAILREVSHYLGCAARLRGMPVPELKVRRRRPRSR